MLSLYINIYIYKLFLRQDVNCLEKRSVFGISGECLLTAFYTAAAKEINTFHMIVYHF